ncbi:MAG TPA: hypothetical protein VFW90_00985 [Candidatus Saccharimonadales bacterium]|nr:hypothetical protein [Candidatus Saccharimonadales bacterium]
MPNVLIGRTTQKQLESLVESPAPAVLIHGPAGSGKRLAAIRLAANMLGISVEDLAAHPYYTLLQKPENLQNIPIEAIRQLISSLKLKAVLPSKGSIRRIVHIDKAQNLSGEAQTALLKLIEEPPERTVFILSVNQISDLLPTIVSRSRPVYIAPISRTEAVRYYESNYSPKEVETAWSLSGGGAGLLEALLSEAGDHPLKSAVAEAKQFLALDSYQRILWLDKHAARKDELAVFLDGLNRVLGALSRSPSALKHPANQKKLLAGRRLVASSLNDLNKNVSLRLICLRLALDLTL